MMGCVLDLVRVTFIIKRGHPENLGHIANQPLSSEKLEISDNLTRDIFGPIRSQKIHEFSNLFNPFPSPIHLVSHHMGFCYKMLLGVKS